MRVSAICSIVKPVPPLLPIVPPPLKKEEPKEPLSFCSRLSRLLEVHRRHLMFERMMNLWTRAVTFLTSKPLGRSEGLNRVA